MVKNKQTNKQTFVCIYLKAQNFVEFGRHDFVHISPSCGTNSGVTSRAVASLTVPGGQEFHFPHFFLKFRPIVLIFLKLHLFSSSFWPSGRASRPPGKALATPLVTSGWHCPVVPELKGAPTDREKRRKGS